MIIFPSRYWTLTQFLKELNIISNLFQYKIQFCLNQFVINIQIYLFYIQPISLDKHYQGDFGSNNINQYTFLFPSSFISSLILFVISFHFISFDFICLKYQIIGYINICWIIVMVLPIFAVKTVWHKNGIWWFTKMASRAVGQKNYDAIRVWRRVWVNKFYYFRQQCLYQCFIETPDLANLLGIYPKMDSSHGYGFYNTYEMYRDFQENTINSDGSFGMWIAYLAAIYCFLVIYNYMLPWYWNKTAICKNGDEARNRMRDAIASTLLEQSTGMQFAEWGWMPHDFHSIRKRMSDGLSHPDDVRAMHMSSLIRKHRYRQHYLKDADQKTKMIGV